MILEEHRDNPDQINPIDQINQEEIQALRVHQADLHQIDLHHQTDHLHRVRLVDQADLHHQIDRLHRVHQVDQADPHHQTDLHLPIDHLHRVHQVGQADLVIQVVIEREVRDQVEAEVHGLEKMNNAMIAVLN